MAAVQTSQTLIQKSYSASFLALEESKKSSLKPSAKCRAVDSREEQILLLRCLLVRCQEGVAEAPECIRVALESLQCPLEDPWVEA